MKKLFLAICFSACCLFPHYLHAAATELNSPMELEAAKQQIPDAATLNAIDEEMPDPNDQNAMDNYMRERFKTVIISDFDDVNNSMNIQHSAEYIAKQTEGNKSTFQKIYDEAINRIAHGGEPQRADITQESNDFYQKQAPSQKEEWEAPDFAVINLDLPTGERIIAPAKEHIPYLFSRIEIMPTGQVSISETITVVANGQKLKNGLSRAIPKYSVSRSGVRNKIALTIGSVEINGQEYPHRPEEKDDKIYIVPTQDYVLDPGVYTYTFNYIIDRKLWEYDDFKEFYWDVTGSSWNLVIARAGASIKLPGNSPALGQTVLLGYTNLLTTENTTIAKGDDNTLGFASKIPLFIGEGMHIIVSLPLADFFAPDFNRRITWFIEDYGNLIFSILGLLAILISYYLSWKGLEKNEQKYSLRKTAPMLRSLSKGVFDKISFGAFLLDLYRKNLIDIQKEGDEIFLVKKTDTPETLNKNERKALDDLFPHKESVLNVNYQNNLKLKRAFKFIEKDVSQKLKRFALKLNLGYLCFSCSMLLMVILATAALSLNFSQTALVLASCCVTIAFYIWVLNHKFKSVILNWSSKFFAIFIILFTMLMMSIYVHPLTTLFYVMMIYAIFAYTAIFAKRNGLIRNNIKEAQEYKSYLLRNADNIVLGRDFLSQQAYIFAFEVGDKFPCNPNIQDYYKLDVAAELIKKL